MTTSEFKISSCKSCRHYSPEGRRGGQCAQFGTLVHAGWKACPLAMPAFAPSWETLERFTTVGVPAEVPAIAGSSPTPQRVVKVIKETVERTLAVTSNAR